VGASGRTWEDIEIRFVSDERAQIIFANESETRNYAEFGFEDVRSQKPNKAWLRLRELAEKRGVVRPPANGRERAAFEKRMQEIRTQFRGLFHLSEDPLPFTRGKGYCARFKIGCAPSYNS